MRYLLIETEIHEKNHISTECTGSEFRFGVISALQANELARPLARLKAMDNNGLLRRTLAAWFRHNVQPLATSKALFIHRNTLEYRLNRISELTGLDLGNFDDRLLLYVALQLDEER